MTDLFAVSRSQYGQRQLLARRAALATRRLWQQVDPTAIRASWATTVGPAVTALVTAAQLEAASTADQDTSALLAAQGVADAPVAAVVARAFAGIASDGRDLPGLLELSNAYTLRAISGGAPVDEALGLGGRWLEMAVGTQVVDAGRVAQAVATATRPDVAGFYRVIVPPSCERCAVLAGAWYRWNAGFERHPRCDCTQIPADDGALADHPGLWTARRYFDSLSHLEQNRVFTAAGAQSIREGADIGQVVNARRGMYVAGGRALTHEAARPYNGARLMPEQIWREAHGSRVEAIRLLRRFGYIR